MCTWPAVGVARPAEKKNPWVPGGLLHMHRIYMILTAAPTKALALIDAVQLDCLFRSIDVLNTASGFPRLGAKGSCSVLVFCLEKMPCVAITSHLSRINKCICRCVNRIMIHVLVRYASSLHCPVRFGFLQSLLIVFPHPVFSILLPIKEVTSRSPLLK